MNELLTLIITIMVVIISGCLWLLRDKVDNLEDDIESISEIYTEEIKHLKNQTKSLNHRLRATNAELRRLKKEEVLEEEEQDEHVTLSEAFAKMAKLVNGLNGNDK